MRGVSRVNAKPCFAAKPKQTTNIDDFMKKTHCFMILQNCERDCGPIPEFIRRSPTALLTVGDRPANDLHRTQDGESVNSDGCARSTALAALLRHMRRVVGTIPARGSRPYEPIRSTSSKRNLQVANGNMRSCGEMLQTAVVRRNSIKHCAVCLIFGTISAEEFFRLSSPIKTRENCPRVTVHVTRAAVLNASAHSVRRCWLFRGSANPTCPFTVSQQRPRAGGSQ